MVILMQKKLCTLYDIVNSDDPQHQELNQVALRLKNDPSYRNDMAKLYQEIITKLPKTH